MKNLRISSKLILPIIAIVLLSSCEDDTKEKITIELPAKYAFERAGESTVSFDGQTTRIAMAKELTTAMLNPEKTGTQLQAMFNHTTGAEDFTNADLNASDKNVRSKVAASADYFSANAVDAQAIKIQLDEWIEAQATSVFVNWETLAVAGTAGQIADGSSIRYVGANGVEYNQIVAKSLIGGLMIDQILNNYLSTAVLDAGNQVEDNNAGITETDKPFTSMEHKWDEAYGYLYGAEVDPSTPVLGADSFLNNYLSRVDTDTDFAGIATEIHDAFKLGRAAIVVKDYDLRDEQVEILRENISLIPAVRAVFYLQAGKTAIAAEDFGGGFHDLSEGLGFVYSLQFSRKPNSDAPYFTKAQVDAFIDDILAGENGLWNVSATTLDEISLEIATAYGFSVAQAAE